MNRESGIELLRGILMFMVVLVHLTGNGVLNKDNPIPWTEPNWVMGNVIDAICYPAVNCFVLISGYFGMRPTLKKFLKLDIPIILYGLMALVLLNEFSLGAAARTLVPVIHCNYWFLTGYVILMLVAPFINKAVDAMDSFDLKVLVFFILFVFVIIPSVSELRYAEPRGMDFVNFSVIYLIGRYIKKLNLNIKRRKSIMLYMISSFFCFGLTLLFAHKYDINQGWQSRFYAYNNILIYVQALSLFFIFKSIRIQSKFINWIAPSFFYIYILHEMPTIHDKLYKWIHLSDYYYSNYFLAHIIICGLLIFCISLCVDIVIRRLMLGIVIEKASSYIESVLNALCKRLHFY